MQMRYVLPSCFLSAVVLTAAPFDALALSSQEVGKIAQSITVRIDGQNPGSGVVIKRQGSTYTVLTAAHVVATDDEYDVVTTNEKRYPLSYRRVKKFPGVDLALVEFDSSATYPVATVGNSQLVESGAEIYVSGFPNPTTAITEPIWTFSPGDVMANANRPLADGYGLVYNNTTLPGMSGGAVLNQKGELIGIHGRADAEQQEQKTETIYVKTGFNLGIPINAFLGLASQIDATLGFANKTPVPATLQADDYFVRGSRKFDQGDYQAAIADFDNAIRLKPDFDLAFAGRGLIQAIQGQTQPSIQDFDRAIQLNPKLTEAYINRGLARSILGDDQAGLADIEQALKLQPDFANAYTSRAVIKGKLKDFEGVIADTTQAIQLRPNFSEAYTARGLGYLSQGKIQAAGTDFNQALQLNPKSADAHNGRAILRFASQDRQGAIADWKQAAQLYKDQGNQLGYQNSLRFIEQASQ